MFEHSYGPPFGPLFSKGLELIFKAIKEKEPIGQADTTKIECRLKDGRKIRIYVVVEPVPPKDSWADGQAQVFQEMPEQ